MDDYGRELNDYAGDCLRGLDSVLESDRRAHLNEAALEGMIGLLRILEHKADLALQEKRTTKKNKNHS